VGTTYRDLIKQIEKDGWQHHRTTGSHMQYRHPDKTGTVTISGGGKLNRQVPPGTIEQRPQAGETQMMDYIVVIERADDGGFGAYVPDLPGCVAAGDTREEAEQLIREAIPLHLASLREHGDPIPQPQTTVTTVSAPAA